MPFPSDSQFQPIMFRGQPLFDPPGDESPANVDIVGDSQYPAAYFAYDGAYVYFRLRLNADPRFKTGFLNFTWGVLFDTDDVPGTYEWLLCVDGLSTSVELIQNTVKEFNSWNDPAEGTNGRGAPNFSQPIVNYNIARARLTGDGSNFGGDPDYFLDFFLPAGTLFNFLGINEYTIIRLLFFTSTNSVNYNKDSLRNQGFQFASAFGDPDPVGEGDFRAKLAVSKTITSGPAAALTGGNLQYTGTITVTNTGKSQATTVYVSDLFGFDLNAAVSIVSVSSGIANYNPGSNTITWNVGNLDVGQSQTLSFIASGQFATPGQRSMDTTTSTGVDIFTGQHIPPASDTFTVNVTSIGSIAGTVLDSATGFPLQGAQILLLDTNGNIVASGSTDAVGGYGLVNISPGNYTLTVNQANYHTASVPVTVQPDQTAIANVLLSPLPAQISGKVTDTLGNPISGAYLRLKSPFGVILQEVQTDGTGIYTISNVSQGSYTLLAEASGFQHAFAGIELAPAQTLVQNFVLPPNPSGVVGTVTGNGQPLQGVLVELLDNANQLVSTTTTDAIGHYSIIGFSPGSYRLLFSKTGFADQLIGLEVGLGETKTINVNLQTNFGSISGLVTDSQTGLPLAHSIIRVVNPAGVTLTSTIADANGFYSVDSLPPGTYAITFSEDGYADQTIGATVISGQDTPVNAALDKLAGAIAGVVTDEFGLPLAQAIIRVFFNELVVATVTTTANGNYQITGLSPGIYTVRAEAAGYIREVLGATVVTFETARADFVLTRNPGILLGTVQDSSGNPLPGSTITVRENTAVSPVIGRTVTDENGNYIFSTLAPGSYIISAECTGFQIGQTSVFIVSVEQTRADFRLQPVPGVISGQILDASTGSPITSANVEVRIVNANGTVIKTTYSDAHGLYTASDLPPGTYAVISSAKNFQTNSASVTLSSGETAIVNLALLPGPGAVTGLVRDAVSQLGIAGATVKVADANGVITGTAITDAQGAFTVTGLAPGSYTISAIADGFQSGMVGAIVPSALTINTILNLLRNPGSIIGTVSPAPNGTLVQLYDTNNLYLASKVADANGLFRFENISEGSYIVTATAPEYSAGQTGVTVYSNQESSVSITLQPQPAAVTGTITDPSGNPVINAVVRFLDQNQTLLGFAATDAEGNYRIGNLPSGNLIVIAAASGFAETIGGVSLLPGETFNGLNFTLIPNPGSITGQITDAATGLPISGTTVIVRLQDAQGLPVSTVTASVFGNYSASNLAPGTYTVIAGAKGYATQSIGATVVSNAATNASFRLSALFGSISGTIFGPRGEILTGGAVSLKLFDDKGVLLETKLSNPDGTYSFTNLPPGNYQVSISSPGLVSQTVTAGVSAGQTTTLDFTLQPLPGTLNGRITNAETGAGIGGAVVTLTDLSDSFVAQGYTDHNGF
ncbi:MSCRAMM family protein [Ferviditalea candida]|uniref:Carboxypeptidase regulatory-like domain-containing protein n=1 Tax=Ferviditalea candida TaxID=3108399 RepID=A0ABU5ZMV8_9BACL|nr:carboxypeptidase regulatory-like domain-containing protein [Paenibacillaceae bacterium T2]